MLEGVHKTIGKMSVNLSKLRADLRQVQLMLLK